MHKFTINFVDGTVKTYNFHTENIAQVIQVVNQVFGRSKVGSVGRAVL